MAYEISGMGHRHEPKESDNRFRTTRPCQSYEGPMVLRAVSLSLGIVGPSGRQADKNTLQDV